MANNHNLRSSLFAANFDFNVVVIPNRVLKGNSHMWEKGHGL
jgi:hypothetical protein